jgi:hypothetical protein
MASSKSSKVMQTSLTAAVAVFVYCASTDARQECSRFNYLANPSYYPCAFYIGSQISPNHIQLTIYPLIRILTYCSFVNSNPMYTHLFSRIPVQWSLFLVKLFLNVRCCCRVLSRIYVVCIVRVLTHCKKVLASHYFISSNNIIRMHTWKFASQEMVISPTMIQLTIQLSFVLYHIRPFKIYLNLYTSISP